MNKYYQRFYAFLEQVFAIMSAAGKWLKVKAPSIYNVFAFVVSTIGLTCIFAEHVFGQRIAGIVGSILFLVFGLVPTVAFLGFMWFLITVAPYFNISLPAAKA